MSDIATISLRVNTSDLERGNQALDQFQQAAGAAAKQGDAFNQSQKSGAGGAKQNTEQLRQQQAELRNLLNQISPVNKALDELDNVQQQLSRFRGSGIVGVEQFERYSEILETTRDRLLAVQDAETAEGRARQQQAQAAERATAAAQSFVASLETQVSTIGKTRTELLELKAAELGVTEQTAPLIARLREQDDAWKKGEISAGQYRQAMRQLPAQITDVVTSLAGGQPVWLVAIQQGGQIKDSFGGIGNAAKALLSFLNPVNVVLGVVAVTMGAVAIHAHSVQTEIAALRDSIGQNLGASGDDAQRLAVNIRAIAEASNKTTDEVQQAFITTKDGASEAIEKLVSVGSSYADARAEVDQYKGAADFTALNGIIEQHKLAITGIRDGWTDAAKAVRDQYAPVVKGLGNVALGGAYDPAQAARQQAEEFEAKSRAGYQQVQEQGKQAVDQIDKQYLATNRLAGAESQLQELLKQRGKASAVGDKQAVDRANYLIDQQNKAIDKIKAGNTKKPATTKQDRGQSQLNTADLDAQRDVLALQVQLDLLDKQQTIGSVISKQRRDLLTTESEISVLTKKAQTDGLNQQEQQKLAADKRTLSERETLATLGDQLEQRKRQVELEKQASKFEQQQQAIRDGIAIRAGGGTDRDVQRAQQRSRIASDPALDDKTRNSELAQLEKTYKAEDDLRGNWLAGAKSAWTEYRDTATNVYSSIHDVAASGFQGLSGMLDDLVTTGTASFKEFAQSILKMIVQVIDRLLVAYAIQSALGWVTAGSGGTTPNGAYEAAAANVQFDSGGYTGDGGKYEPKGTVHGGEFVFTKEATSALGVDNLYALMNSAQGYANGGYVGRAPMAGMNSGGAAGSGIAVNTTVNVDANGGSTAQSSGSGDSVGRALAAEIQQAALQVVQKQLKNGGIIYNFVKGR
ncbi:phage tail tape measure protein [Klebsiella variicola subsp. variicola]|uniref:phage tail tape measure protein n=1 Tax=Klebsiella variicola TaxID=244366 RepID=UPI001E5E566D|nr:phage tail tape measure protein [Klebsiella variicola]MCD9775871.1 phage tail tape measure protein [Klebsiella variicola subsp. variicola]